jgi:hypothetical protein
LLTTKHIGAQSGSKHSKLLEETINVITLCTFIFQIEKNMQLAGKDDANRRKKLTSVMTDMMSIIHKQGPNMVPRRDSQLVEGLLRTEGTSDNLADDCRAYIDDLETGECVMIVAGRYLCFGLPTENKNICTKAKGCA